MADYRNRGWNDDDDDDRVSRPSGGGVGSSSIAYESGRKRSGRRRLFMLALALVIVGGFGSIVWNAYNQGQRSGGDAVVPLIQADDTPTKVRPEQPGGMDVPNQDKLIYDRLNPGQNASSSVERLLPPPEAPVARPEPQPQQQAAAPEATPAPRTPVEPANDLEAPTIATRPTPSVPTTPPAQPAKPAQQQAAKPAQQQANPPAPSAPAAVASIPPASSSAGGNFRVQLGAVRSQDAAQKEWARLQKANNDLLGKLGLNVSQANLGDRGTFYRIQAGPVGDQQAASDLCAKLKARKVSCIIVKQ